MEIHRVPAATMQGQVQSVTETPQKPTCRQLPRGMVNMPAEVLRSPRRSLLGCVHACLPGHSVIFLGGGTLLYPCVWLCGPPFPQRSSGFQRVPFLIKHREAVFACAFRLVVCFGVWGGGKSPPPPILITHRARNEHV